ncbi:MAG: gamma-glutamyl-gamma-aminobutyrate hydrolase family protein [Candidatus Binataceae bacterium]|nr:gamma-glutamyl-gamma-aminobutyrate hydrolase family protein [Candidatus Binataceae bacterium]
MSKLLVLQHHPGESLGLISEALQSAALAWQYVRSYDGQKVPADMKGAEGLIVMGGPQGAYELDKYPYLRDEIALIQAAIRADKPVLGICLGSQLVAAALGARVAPASNREMGFLPVTLESAAHQDRMLRGLPVTFTACHWHGDIFDLPTGAVALASSAKTACQAFRFGEKVYALLFHVEITEAMLLQWLPASARELDREGLSGAAIIADGERHLLAIEPIAETIFERWAAMVKP